MRDSDKPRISCYVHNLLSAVKKEKQKNRETLNRYCQFINGHTHVDIIAICISLCGIYVLPIHIIFVLSKDEGKQNFCIHRYVFRMKLVGRVPYLYSSKMTVGLSTAIFALSKQKEILRINYTLQR